MVPPLMPLCVTLLSLLLTAMALGAAVLLVALASINEDV